VAAPAKLPMIAQSAEVRVPVTMLRPWGLMGEQAAAFYTGERAAIGYVDDVGR